MLNGMGRGDTVTWEYEGAEGFTAGGVWERGELRVIGEGIWRVLMGCRWRGRGRAVGGGGESLGVLEYRDGPFGEGEGKRSRFLGSPVVGLHYYLHIACISRVAMTFLFEADSMSDLAGYISGSSFAGCFLCLPVVWSIQSCIQCSVVGGNFSVYCILLSTIAIC